MDEPLSLHFLKTKAVKMPGVNAIEEGKIYPNLVLSFSFCRCSGIYEALAG